MHLWLVLKLQKQEGLYGAGQDLLKDSFSGNIKGMGPGVAEMEFDERPNEAFTVFAADKTEPGAFNYPLYRLFVDALSNTGLIVNKSLANGVIIKHHGCGRRQTCKTFSLGR